VTLSIVFGLGTWLGFEFLAEEGIVEPHLYGLAASAVGMILGAFAGAPGQYVPQPGHQATEEPLNYR
jgi:solute:Na+ symporter, SSS family